MKPLEIPRYWRVVIAVVIAITMFAIIYVVSKFRVPPGINILFSILWILIVYATLEAVRYFQLKFYDTSLFKNKTYSRAFAFLGSIITGTFSFFSLSYLFKWLDHFINGSEVPMFHHMVVSGLIGLVISIIFALIQFAISWKNEYFQTHLEKEQFKKELARANLSILKNQLDPHFMFNNFNTLYYLIDEDSELAQKFLANVASVYRYILQNNEKSIIPVSDEYEMCKQYLSLIEQRYQNNLLIEDTIDISAYTHKCIPPLVLQQLIENAIKHNRIDEKAPLTIHFNADSDYLTVRNNTNSKRTEHNSGTGLINIEKRYKFLTDKKVVVSKNVDTFSVSVPLISTPIDH